MSTNLERRQIMIKCLNNFFQTGDNENLKDIYRLIKWHAANLKWSDAFKNILLIILLVGFMFFVLLNLIVVASVVYESDLNGTTYIEEFRNHLIILSNLEH